MDIIVQHRVRDYEAWKPAFDEHEPTRVKHGCLGHTVYRSADDPNEVTVITSWRSRDGAEDFMRDPSLKEAMEKGGVISEPRITLLEAIETHPHAASRAGGGRGSPPRPPPVSWCQAAARCRLRLARG
jgi:quinol monooxygenase YgiN